MGPTHASEVRTPAEIMADTKDSVVLIKSEHGLGTGFVVWQDGRIATAFHVLSTMEVPTVVFADGREFRGDEIEVMAVDVPRDLAVIRVKGVHAKPVKLGDARAVRAGDPVVAIGHPLGLDRSISDGLVSGLRPLAKDFSVLQISVPIAQGSSGGPILNQAGQVIGVAAAFAQEGQNINFAIPVTYLEPLLLVEDAEPFSAFREELASSAQKVLARAVADCGPDSTRDIVTQIQSAISVGAPTYNKGDHQGCFDIYRKKANELIAQHASCSALAGFLREGVSRSEAQKSATDSAWAMRYTFDAILIIAAQVFGAQP